MKLKLLYVRSKLKALTRSFGNQSSSYSNPHADVHFNNQARFLAHADAPRALMLALTCLALAAHWGANGAVALCPNARVPPVFRGVCTPNARWHSHHINHIHLLISPPSHPHPPPLHSIYYAPLPPTQQCGRGAECAQRECYF